MAKRPVLPDPAEVLRGRARVTIEQLFALIHAANPTDRGLSARQEAERYAQKARLQSLLIREHAVVLQVVPDPSDARVISLQHRLGQRDACHARMDALDEEARRWVEAELSAAPPLPPTTGPALGKAPASGKKQAPASSADPLALGRRALEAYDFDEAATRFKEAICHPALGVDGARALLDLLVNHLADDAAALVLEPSMPNDARVDAVVLGRLAVAAARLGDPRARRWLRGADAESAVESLVILGERAARDSQGDELRSCITELQDRDPLHPALPGLSLAQGRLRQAARGPLEFCLGVALQADDWEAVERLSRELLLGWPESEPARAAGRLLERRGREKAARDLVSRAREAERSGEAESVLLAVGQVRAINPEDPELLRWLDETEVAAQDRADMLEIERLRGLLDAGRLPEALVAWPRLRPGVQAALRQSHPLPELDWLGALPPGDERVPAVLGLRAAQLAIERGDLSTAERHLNTHSRALRGQAVAASLRRSLAARQAEAEEQATARRLEQVGEARAAGRLVEALALCRTLPPEHRRRLQAELEAEKSTAEALRRRSEAMEQGDLIAALDLARRAGDAVAETEIDQQLRASWSIRCGEGLDIGVGDVVISEDPVVPLPWLCDGGDAFVYAQVCDGWVVARVVELASFRVRRVVMMRAPAPMLLHYVIVEGDIVTLVDLFGAMLRFRLSNGEPVRWRPRPSGLPAAGTWVVSTILAPGGRTLWMTLLREGHPELRVYDTERWPSFQPMEEPGLAIPLLGNEVPAVACLRRGTGDSDKKGARVYAPNGAPLSRQVWVAEAHLTRACIHPAGFPLCATLDATEHRDEVARKVAAAGHSAGEVVARPLGLYRPGPDRDHGSIELFGRAVPTEPHQIAASREDGVLYLKDNYRGICQIRRFTPRRDNQRLDNIEGPYVPASTMLLSDAGSRWVRAITRTETGLRSVPLDGTAPVGDAGTVAQENYRLGWPDIGLQGDLGCPARTASQTPAAEALRRTLLACAGEARGVLFAELRALHAEEPGLLFDLADAMHPFKHAEEALALFDETGKRFPDHGLWRLVRARQAALRNDWPQVQATLDGVSTEGLDEVSTQHFFHLRGVARLRGGDREGGEADIRLAATLPGRCALHLPLQLVELLNGAPIPDEINDSDTLCRVRLGPVVHGILAADRHLAAGEHEAALAALDHPTTWRSRDRQALARVAEAWLGITTDDPVRSLRRRVALATFLGAMELHSMGRALDLPIPPHTWEAERLADLRRRVSDALTD